MCALSAGEDEVSNAYYYHNDHLATPQKMTDGSGAVVWFADYKPFGEVTVTVSTITNNLRFPGQYFDVETGLNYNYFRDYNPVIGRYIESDPIGQEGGVNLYTYAANNAMNFIDASGLQAQCGQSPCNKPWDICYTNCINTLAPGFSQFFVGTQIATNAPYNVVIRPDRGGNLALRVLPRSVAFMYRFPGTWGALTTISRAAWQVQSVGLAWVAGSSIGCMISCTANSCSY